MINDNCIPTSAPRGGIGPSNALGELGIRVGKEELFDKSKRLINMRGILSTHDGVPHSVNFAPSAHYEGIVESKDCNNVYTLFLELGEVLDISGDVIGRASGGKGTGDREEDNLLIRPLLGGIITDGDSA